MGWQRRALSIKRGLVVVVLGEKQNDRGEGEAEAEQLDAASDDGKWFDTRRDSRCRALGILPGK